MVVCPCSDGVRLSCIALPSSCIILLPCIVQLLFLFVCCCVCCGGECGGVLSMTVVVCVMNGGVCVGVNYVPLLSSPVLLVCLLSQYCWFRVVSL